MKATAIAVCGMAALLGTALAAPARAQDSTLIAANMLGQEVAGGEGDDDASANFNGEIDLKRNELCYYLDMDGLKDATSVQIHQVEQAGSDPPTLALALPGPDGDEVCVAGDNAVLAAIAKEPGQYYIDIHSRGHPAGAVRGKIT